jgi:hypothetical protein
MRVLVCGGRDFENSYGLYDTLDEIHKNTPITTLIQGEAKGADKLAKAWAEYNKVPTENYPANWDRDGKAAGPIRNKKMLVDGKPDLVVAFPGGAGTFNMINQAKSSGVRVEQVKISKDWRDE